MKGCDMARSKRGRPKGSRNRITNEAKQAILMAFDKLGGVEGLVAWAKEDKANLFAFYTRIYPRLLPRPAVDVAIEPEQLAPVRGALIWRKPTPSPYPPLAASTAAAAAAADVTDDAGTRPPEGRALESPG